MAKKPVFMGNTGWIQISEDEGQEKKLNNSKKSTPVNTPSSSDLDKIIDIFQEVTDHCFEVPPAKANEENYRQVLISGWPTNVHYEFVSRKNSTTGELKGRKAGLCLELHCEGNHLQLIELIPVVAETQKHINSIELTYLKFFKKPALVLQLPSDFSFNDIAKTMQEFIEQTYPTINSAAISSQNKTM